MKKSGKVAASPRVVLGISALPRKRGGLTGARQRAKLTAPGRVPVWSELPWRIFASWFGLVSGWVRGAPGWVCAGLVSGWFALVSLVSGWFGLGLVWFAQGLVWFGLGLGLRWFGLRLVWFGLVSGWVGVLLAWVGFAPSWFEFASARFGLVTTQPKTHTHTHTHTRTHTRA